MEFLGEGRLLMDDGRAESRSPRGSKLNFASVRCVSLSYRSFLLSRYDTLYLHLRKFARKSLNEKNCIVPTVESIIVSIVLPYFFETLE